jgi:hypothetical protein
VRAAVTRLKNTELGAVIRELEEVGKQLAQLVAPVPQVSSNVNVLDSGSPRGGVKMSAPATAPAAVERVLRRTEEKASARVSGED